ncbi:MAG: zinc ABC transporter substrate-binding protein [Microcoleaceae cyanobacterium]
MFVFKNLNPPQTYSRMMGAVTSFMVLLMGCAAPTPQETTSLVPEETTSLASEETTSTKIMATFLPMYLFTKAVAGPEGEVELLVPANANIHSYQASPDEIRSLTEADILIKNGLGLEEFLDKMITNTANSQLQQIDASQGIEPLQEEEKHSGEDHDHDHDHGHSHEGGNPHVWLDPILAQEQVINIRDGLIAADPENSQTYQTNAAAYLSQLQQLDQQFKAQLASLKGCQFIAFHDAYPYLAERYGLEQIAVIQLPEDSLSPSDIQRVINTAQQYNIKALLSETGVEDNRLQRISEDTGLPVKTLDPIETGNLDPQYYLTAMENNLQTLVEACQ